MNAEVDNGLEVVVLAAGKGTRMYSDLPKVLHELAGEPLLAHVLRHVKQLGPGAVHVVLGHGAERIKDRFKHEQVRWVQQQPQLGTGHAVQAALPGISPQSKVLVVYGDVPLAGPPVLRPLLQQCAPGNIALLTVTVDDPGGLGRIIRNPDGAVVAIVEDKDAEPDQLNIKEVNTGIVAVYAEDLSRLLEHLGNDNAQQEYYLTDVVQIAVSGGYNIVDSTAADPVGVAGVNTKMELACLEQHMRKQRARELLEQGVTIVDPDRFDARGDVSFGKDCVVDINVVLQGPLTIGSGVHIGPHCVISRSEIGDGVTIKPQCVIEEARIGADAIVGPFSRVRPGARIGDNVHIGNFVEIKNSELSSGTKVNHLSYVGDSTVGHNVNIGAGVITCNYDGTNKHRTEIEDDVFVGSNSQLIAPVKLGRGANVGAGSTISEDVPPGHLAVGRARQKNIKGWQRPRKKRP